MDKNTNSEHQKNSLDEKKVLQESWNLDAYDYHLPEERIAQTPRDRRGDSRLLVLDTKGQDTVTRFEQLMEHLPKDALLVANNSRVVPARLKGTGANEKKAEFLLLTPLPLMQPVEREGGMEADVQGLLKGAKRFKAGDVIAFASQLHFELQDKGDFGKVTGRLSWTGSLEAQLQQCGEPPLPPYIKRQTETGDIKRYQTVYANVQEAGSVAAPTAGLHFAKPHLQALSEAGFSWAEVTLYVGYGTFSPIRCQDIREHAMHAEYVRVSQQAAQQITEARTAGRPIVAVGTTVVRTLEGVVQQQGRLAPFAGWVNLFIKPGFRFQVVDHLLTNFHLPRSSLLVLVSALAGRERVLAAYDLALASDFQFFSYGDAMLVL